MAPLIYPEPTWSNRFGRVVRTLQVVAIAGAIGAVGGGVAVMALVGGTGSSHQATALKVSPTEKIATSAAHATHPEAVAPVLPQPNPDAAAAARVAPAVPAAAEANAQQPPAVAEPSSTGAATDQHPVQQAAEPASSAPGTQVYNRAEPDTNNVPIHPSRKAKVARRTKNAEHGRRERSPAYSGDTGRYSDWRDGPYPAARYSYGYDPRPVVRAPPPGMRGYYFGGGGAVYDRGGTWGN